MTEPRVSWVPGPSSLELSAVDLHVWMAFLKDLREQVSLLADYLTQEEKERARKYKSPADYQRFVVARVVLRLILSRYTGVYPKSLQIQKGPREKPYLVTGVEPSRVRFNLSHGDNVALFAFAVNRELGIDVMKVEPDPQAREIARRYFAKEEIDELESLPEAVFYDGFFQCWTRKEAYVKALGRGMEMPLSSFSVSVSPRSAFELRSQDSAQWSLYSFRPCSGYVAALVAEKNDWRVSYYDATNINPLHRR